MEIKETDTFVIIEDAPLSFYKAMPLIPYPLIWFEVTASVDIMEGLPISGTGFPNDVDQIQNFDINDVVDMESVENDGAEIKLDLYYLKER